MISISYKSVAIKEIISWIENILSSQCTVLSTIFFRELTNSKPIRQRGPAPALSDAEVITMQVVGEFLGMDGDKTIWQYFSANWRDFFPKIGDRAAFVRQAANLSYWINKLHQKIASKLGAFEDLVHVTDGFPIPVAQMKRAHFTRVHKGEAGYGYCAAKGFKYYGFKGHVVISSLGTVTNFTAAAAQIDERDILPENVVGIFGRVLADKGLLRPELKQELSEAGINLEYPLRSNMKEERSDKYLQAMSRQRRLVETVIGQLTERFNIQKVRARNLWTLTLRLSRKILSHTIGMFLNMKLGRPLLQLEGLVA